MVIAYQGRTDVIDLTGGYRNPKYVKAWLQSEGIRTLSTLCLTKNADQMRVCYPQTMPLVSAEEAAVPSDCWLPEPVFLMGAEIYQTDLVQITDPLYTVTLADDVLQIQFGNLRFCVGTTLEKLPDGEWNAVICNRWNGREIRCFRNRPSWCCGAACTGGHPAAGNLCAGGGGATACDRSRGYGDGAGMTGKEKTYAIWNPNSLPDRFEGAELAKPLLYLWCGFGAGAPADCGADQKGDRRRTGHGADPYGRAEAGTESAGRCGRQFSMFSEYNCIQVHDCNADSLREEQLKQLLELLKTVGGATVLIFDVTGFDVKNGKRNPTGRNKKLIDCIAKYGVVCEAVQRTPAVLAKELSAMAEKLGCTFPQKSAEELVRLCMGNTLILQGELEKLCAYADGGTITTDMVREMTSPQLETTTFNLARAVVARSRRRQWRSWISCTPWEPSGRLSSTPSLRRFWICTVPLRQSMPEKALQI